MDVLFSPINVNSPHSRRLRIGTLYYFRPRQMGKAAGCLQLPHDADVCPVVAVTMSRHEFLAFKWGCGYIASP